MIKKYQGEPLTLGQVLATDTVMVRRENLVMYAGASGDFNPIHWNERVATSVGLPNVIAHGMYTMAQAGRLVTDWCGDPGAVLEFRTRFSNPVVVPDDETGTRLDLRMTVVEVLDDGVKVRVEIVAVANGVDVLAGATALISLV